jgi:hypothetical protein
MNPIFIIVALLCWHILLFWQLFSMKHAEDLPNNILPVCSSIINESPGTIAPGKMYGIAMCVGVTV